MGDNTAKNQGQKKSWFKGLKTEFNKVVWPDRKTLAKQTTAVVTVSVLLGALIALVDNFIKYGLEFLVK